MINSLEKLKRKCIQKNINAKILQEEKTKKIISKYGSKKNFIDKLNIEIIEYPNNPRLREIYDFYATFFPLEDERESFEGLQKTLTLNLDKKLQEKLSAFKECWLLAYCSEGELIAGINFTSQTFPKEIAIEHKINGSGNIIYIFVKEKFRMLGIARHLLNKAEEHIKNYTNSLGLYKEEEVDPIITCEMNAPELMETNDFYTDMFFSGINPCDRALWWSNKNYKRLCFNYAQPPLTKEGIYCTSLTLNIKHNSKKPCISGKLVFEHLWRYFYTSIFKGSYPENDIYLKELEKFLLENNVNIFDNEEYYNELKTKHIYQKNFLPMKNLFEHPKIPFTPSSKK